MHGNVLDMKTSRLHASFSITLFLLTALLSGCGSSPDEKKAVHFEKGLEYAEAGNHAAAVIEFRNAVEIDPRFADARYQLGVAYLRTERPRSALEELERAAGLDPSNTDAMLKAAEIYALINKPAESRQFIERLFESGGNTSDAYALLAQLEMQEDNIKAAEKAIGRALEHKPGESRYLIIQARILLADGRVDASAAALKEAVTLDPSTRNMRQLIGFYMSQTENGEAEDIVLSFLEKTPAPHDLYLEMASFYSLREEPGKAEEYILLAIDNNPGASWLKIYLGNFYSTSGDFEKAEKAYQAAVEIAGETGDEKAVLADWYLNTGRYDEAAELADSVLKINPRHPMGKYIKARLLIQNKKSAEALAILEELTKSYPNWGELHYQKGVAHLNLGETGQSFAAAEKAMAYAPNTPEAKTLMAQHLLLKRDFSAAKEMSMAALQQNRRNLRAGIILGKAMAALGENKEAMDILEQMTKFAPDNPEILFNTAGVYMASGRIREGMEMLEKILASDPGFVPAMAAVSKALIEQEKFEEAISRLRKQIVNSPGTAHYRIMLAEILNNYASAPGEAIELLAGARDIAPDIPHTYQMTAGILAGMGKTDEAIRNYREMIRKNPDSLEGYMALGTLFEKTGNLENAKAAYAEALAIQGNFAPAANNLAWLEATSENPDLGEALRLALIAKQGRPEDPYISDTLGYVHYLRGSYGLALTQFAQAIQNAPDMPIIRYHMALALHADGQTATARQELEKTLETKRDFPERDKVEALLGEITAGGS